MRRTGDGCTLLAEEGLYHRQLTDAMAAKYQLADPNEVVTVANRKDVQLVVLQYELRAWEKLAIQRYGTEAAINGQMTLLQDMIRDYILPRLEQYYGAKIHYWRLFHRRIVGETVHAFTVKIFERSIFKGVGVAASPRE